MASSPNESRASSTSPQPDSPARVRAVGALRALRMRSARSCFEWSDGKGGGPTDRAVAVARLEVQTPALVQIPLVLQATMELPSMPWGLNELATNFFASNYIEGISRARRIDQTIVEELVRKGGNCSTPCLYGVIGLGALFVALPSTLRYFFNMLSFATQPGRGSEA